jgi:hypothetical protein
LGGLQTFCTYALWPTLFLSGAASRCPTTRRSDMQLKLRFAEEDSERPPDPPAWVKLDAGARAKALSRLALMIARMLPAREADHD